MIGETESPIVPILTGDEERTIALWQQLLAEGLYVNLIVPPGCPGDECVLRASCSAAHTPEQITRALEIFERVGAELGVTRVAMSCNVIATANPPAGTRRGVREPSLQIRSRRRRRGDRAGDRRGRRILPTPARRSAGC